MTRRLLDVIGFSAAALDAVSLICFGTWLSQTDWMFGHYSGPPGPLLAAMWSGVGGLVATAMWLGLCIREGIRAPHEAAPRSARPWLKWVFGIGLVLLCVPIGFIVMVGKSALPKAQWEAGLKELDSASATVPQLIQAIKSDDYHRRWRAAQAVSKSVMRNSPAEMPSDMPPAAEFPTKTVDVRADRKHLPELVAALADSLTGQDLIGSESAAALGALGRDAESAVPALVAAARRASGEPESEHDTDVLRWRSVEALAQIRPAGMAALIKLVDDKNPAVRRQVVGQLGTIGPEAKAAIPALERVLNDDDEAVRQRAQIALPRIDPHWKPPADGK